MTNPVNVRGQRTSSSGRPVKMTPSATGRSPRASTCDAWLRSPLSSELTCRIWAARRLSASRIFFSTTLMSPSICVRRLSIRRRSSSDCWCKMSSFSAALAFSDQGIHVSTYPRLAKPIGLRAAPPVKSSCSCRPIKRLMSVLVLRSPFLSDRQAAAIPSGVASASPACATPTPIHRIQSDRVTPGSAAAWTTLITMTVGSGITVTVCRRPRPVACRQLFRCVRALQYAAGWIRGQVACHPEKRKVDSSILSLTTSYRLVPSALTSANTYLALSCPWPWYDRGCPFVTVVRHPLSHVDRTPRPVAALMVFKSIRGSPGRRRCDQHHWRSRLDRKARSSRIYPAYRLCLLNPRTLTPGEGNRLVSTRQISARCKTARRPLPREGIIAHHLLGSPGYRSMDFGALALVIAQRSTYYERVLRACHPGVAQDVGTPPPWSSSSSRTVQG